MASQETVSDQTENADSREALRQLYRDLQSYVDWSDSDAEHLVEIGKLVHPHIPSLVEDFYDRLRQHDRAAKVITGGELQIARLKSTLTAWLEQLFAGSYDDEYLLHRWQVGWRHVQIGLDQIYCNVALTRLRIGVTRILVEKWEGEPRRLTELLVSLNRLIDLDLAIIDHAYHVEFMQRHERTQRLATIGQVAGGVAHELRNPLNVIKLSIYYLLNAHSPTPEKTQEHLQKIDRQVGACDKVIGAISDFAKLGSPVREPVEIVTLLRETAANQLTPSNVKVEFTGEERAKILADSRQLQVVFGNLLRNAYDAMKAGGVVRLEVAWHGEELAVHVHDEGEGISRENVHRIAEPLYTTKSRGIGLGLAITKAILDKHQARLEVTSEEGCGSTFSVFFLIPTDGNGQ